jgi:hypothetical protein
MKVEKKGCGHSRSGGAASAQAGITSRGLKQLGDHGTSDAEAGIAFDDLLLEAWCLAGLP